MTDPWTVHLPRPHDKQLPFLQSKAPRRIVRAGRRGGKTVVAAIDAVQQFLSMRRVLYAAPTADQIQRFWFQVTKALYYPIAAGVLRKNETEHIIELPGTECRIRAKTAWNADTLRGDYADRLYFDEWQMMNEDAWNYVGAPMLLDNNGTATFIYTPPTLQAIASSKARDPQHAAKLWKQASLDVSGRWECFHFSSHDNPHLSRAALEEIVLDMSEMAYRMEVLAEDVDEAPGSLWKRAQLDKQRIYEYPSLERIVISVDPSGSSRGDEVGIMAGGKAGRYGYLLEDASLQGSPEKWGQAVVDAYHKWQADVVIAETNYGGEMVVHVINSIDPTVNVKSVVASRGKLIRAEPISTKYSRKEVFHVGRYPRLEDELCLWMPGQKSPNRLDAVVWLFTELLVGAGATWEELSELGTVEDFVNKWR